MRRDWDTIRDILLRCEASNGWEFFSAREQKPDVMLHVRLLVQAGLLQEEEVTGDGSVIVRDMTWGGHDLLDCIRDEDEWDEVKERLQSTRNIMVAGDRALWNASRITPTRSE